MQGAFHSLEWDSLSARSFTCKRNKTEETEKQISTITHDYSFSTAATIWQHLPVTSSENLKQRRGGTKREREEERFQKTKGLRMDGDDAELAWMKRREHSSTLQWGKLRTSQADTIGNHSLHFKEIKSDRSRGPADSAETKKRPQYPERDVTNAPNIRVDYWHLIPTQGSWCLCQTCFYFKGFPFATHPDSLWQEYMFHRVSILDHQTISTTITFMSDTVTPKLAELLRISNHHIVAPPEVSGSSLIKLILLK